MSVMKAQKTTFETRVFDCLVSTFPDFQCTITDIKFPRKEFVIGFYLYALEQLRFNPNKLNDLLDEQLQADSPSEALMYRDTLQLANLSRLLRTIFNKLNPKDGLRFGMFDLVDPSSARNSAFMFTLLNFFTFADSRVLELQEKLHVVGERKIERNQLLDKREKLARERNHVAEMKAKKGAMAQQVQKKKLELATLTEESASLEKLSDRRQEEVEEVKRHLTRLQTQAAELNQTYQKLQSQQVQSPDVLQNNYKHLQAKLKETKLLLEQTQESSKSKKKTLQYLENVAKEQENRLVLIEEIVNQAKELKKLSSDLASLETQVKSDVAVTDTTTVKINGYKNTISHLSAQLTTLQLQHEKTKSSLKESIRHYREEKKTLEDKESSEVESTLEAINVVQMEVNDLIEKKQ